MKLLHNAHDLGVRVATSAIHWSSAQQWVIDGRSLRLIWAQGSLLVRQNPQSMSTQRGTQ